jgi:hypothetical protein
MARKSIALRRSWCIRPTRQRQASEDDELTPLRVACEPKYFKHSADESHRPSGEIPKLSLAVRAELSLRPEGISPSTEEMSAVYGMSDDALWNHASERSRK